LRLQAIELEVETALTRQNVATEDAIATFCGMPGPGLPIPNNPAQISAIMADKAARGWSAVQVFTVSAEQPSDHAAVGWRAGGAGRACRRPRPIPRPISPK
jgi:hypothetical protein